MTRIPAVAIIFSLYTCKEAKEPFTPPEVFEADESAYTPKPTAHQEIAAHMESQAELAKKIQEEAAMEREKMQVSGENVATPLKNEQKDPSPEQLAAMIEEESEDEIDLNHVTLDTIKEEMSESSSGQDYKNKLFLRGLAAVRKGDIETAKNNYLESCQLGHYHSCHKFAYYEQKAGNFTNAIRFYKISCGQGIFKSCNNLAFGAEQAGDYESAKDYYSKACINKHEISCKNLRRLLIKESLAR